MKLWFFTYLAATIVAFGNLQASADTFEGDVVVPISDKLDFIAFEPTYQTYLWGGNRIAELYGRKGLPVCTAESWELADRQEGMSIAYTQPFQGMTLNELLMLYGELLIGKGQEFEKFPLLVKVIDAKQDLSVQVHPNEEMALELSSEAKAEAWYALEDSVVYIGFNRIVSEDQVKEAINSNTLDILMKQIPLKKGEIIYIPGGTLHAIAKGSLILEVQQNSNTTYRLYDWGRVGADGKPRPLHIDEGIKCLNLESEFFKGIRCQEKRGPSHAKDILLWTPYFNINEINIVQEYAIELHPEYFIILFCSEGQGVVTTGGKQLNLKAGKTVLLPAAAGQSLIQGHNLKLIEIIPRWNIKN